MQYTREQLIAILSKHAAWLRGETEGARANLSRANLSGADLFGADLFGANLSRADLFGANLSEANLSGANLYGANLSEANLYGANLSEANLSEANLSGANLSRADLTGANLTNSAWPEAKTDFPVWNFQLGKHLAVAAREFLSIGCQRHEWTVWLSDFGRIGTEAGYTPEEIARYGQAIQLFHKLIQSAT